MYILYTYIYIYICRERERDVYTCTCIYIYIYIYIDRCERGWERERDYIFKHIICIYIYIYICTHIHTLISAIIIPVHKRGEGATDEGGRYRSCLVDRCSTNLRLLRGDRYLYYCYETVSADISTRRYTAIEVQNPISTKPFLRKTRTKSHRARGHEKDAGCALRGLRA